MKNAEPRLLVFLFLFIAGVQTSAQQRRGPALSQAPSPPASASQTVQVSSSRLDSIESRLAGIDQALNRTSIDARLAEIEKSVRESKPQSLFTTLVPSLIAFLGVIAGVLIGGYGQARLAQKQAKLQIGNAVIDWEIKQLSLLYGPLRALLGQSFALYRQMNEVLLTHGDLFRMATGADPDKQEFQIQISPGNWTRFRTVIHISRVYGQGLGIETYFDEIVSIGSQMVKIIQQYAGYSRAEEEDLMEVFGKYLAHFAVLKAVHDAAKVKLVTAEADSENPTTVQSPHVNVSAVFPEVIHILINQGFQAITADVEQWRRRAVA